MAQFTEQLGLAPKSANWPHPFAPWMRLTLVLAALYNALWGAFVILFPLAIFDWVGMAPPRYPELWQCVGMIVGVYGVGYLAAASHPYRHWPIVLVGFLGKILGPIGFAKALIEERFSPWFALNILTNDLIWWVPFGLMLKGAYDHWKAEDAETTTLYRGHEEVTFDHFRSQHHKNLKEMSEEAPVLLVLLRHSGCTFCRKMLDEMKRLIPLMNNWGVQPVFVHMGPENLETQAFFAHYGLEDFPRISDPERIIYKTLGINRGGLRQMFGLKSFRRGVPALLEGHGVGALEGDGFQLSGVAVLRHGHCLALDVHENASDTTNVVHLLENTPEAFAETPAPPH